jgi:hypothetical protein
MSLLSEEFLNSSWPIADKQFRKSSGAFLQGLGRLPARMRVAGRRRRTVGASTPAPTTGFTLREGEP